MLKRILQAKDTIIDLFVLLFVSFTPLFWFKGNEVITGFDSGYPINPTVHFLDRLFVWSNRFGFGQDRSMDVGGFFIHGQEALLQTLGFSLQAEQKIIFISWFFLIGLSIYIFARSVFSYKQYRLLPLIAALFLMFNPYTTQSWPVVERAKFGVIIGTSFISTSLYWFFKDKLSWWKTAFSIAFTMFLFNADGADGIPLNAGMIIFCLTFYLFLFLGRFSGKNENFWKFFYSMFLKPFLLLVGSLFLLDAYWILPFLNFAKGVVSSGAVSVQGLLDWLRVVSAHASPENLLRLEGEPGWYEVGTTHPFGPQYLVNPFLIAVSYLWPILAFGAYFLTKQKKYITIFMTTAVIGIFFAAGSHAPTGPVFEFLFTHIPGFYLVRSAWFKFNYVISISYALLIAFSVQQLYLWLKTKKGIFGAIFMGIFFVILGFYNFPYFGQKMFEWNKPLTLMVNVPQYIYDFSNWANKQPPSENMLILPPLNQNWNAVAYTWGYYSFATPPTTLLTNRNTLANQNYFSPSQQSLLNSLYDAIKAKDMDRFKELISILHVSYFVVQKDVYTNLSWIPSESPAIYGTALQQIPGVTLVKSFGSWDVYQYKPSLKSYISYPTTLVATNAIGDSLLSLMISKPNAFFTSLDATNSFPVNQTILQADCVSCSLVDNNFSLPSSPLLPGSLLYKFTVQRNDVKRFQQARVLPFDEKVNVYIGLSLKRLSELSRSSFQPNQALFAQSSLDLNSYIKQLHNTFAETSSTIDTISTEKRVIDFVDFATRVLKRYVVSGPSYPQYISQIKSTISSLDSLETQIKDRSILQDPFTTQIYSVSIPTDNKYIFTSDIVNTLVTLDNKQLVNQQAESLKKGIHTLIVTTQPQSMSLDTTDILINDSNSSGKTISLPVQPQTYYKISFQYAVTGTQEITFPITLLDSNNGKTVVNAFDLFPGESGTTSLLVKPTDNSRAIQIAFPGSTNNSSATTGYEVHSLTVQKVLENSNYFFESQQQPIYVVSLPSPLNRVNQTRYDMVLEKNPGQFYISFADSFNPEWKLYIDNKVLPESRHLTGNGYGNVWFVKQSDFQKYPPHEVTLSYMPQSIFMVGAIISATAFVAILCIIIFNLLSNKKWQ